MTLHDAYQKAKRAAGESDEYVNICPFCGKPAVDLIGFTGSCQIPVRPDGWDLGDGGVDTSDEVFQCRSCKRKIPTTYVFP